MAEIKIKLKDLLDDYVEEYVDDLPDPPLPLPPWSQIFNKMVDFLDDAGVLNDEVRIPIPSDIIDSLTGGGGDDSGGDDGGWQSNNLPPIPPLVPIEPKAAMNAIAAAVRDAEKILNMENLAIGGAGVDVSLVVDVAGVAGANANFKITIGPTPRP